MRKLIALVLIVCMTGCASNMTPAQRYHKEHKDKMFKNYKIKKSLLAS